MFSRMPRFAGRLRLPAALFRVVDEVGLTAVPSSRALRAHFGLRRGERFSMDDEARATGLGPAADREPKDSSKGGPRRGRRSPFRHPRPGEPRGGAGAKALGGGGFGGAADPSA